MEKNRSAQSVMALIGAKLIMVLTPRWSLLAGSLFAGLYLFLMSISTSLPFLYAACLFQGGVLGLGAFASGAGVISGWIKKKTASVIGVAFGLAAFGSAIVGFVSGQLLQTMGFRQVLQVFAAAVVVLGVLVNLCLIRKPKATETAAQPGAAAAAPAEGIPFAKAVKSPAFILFFVGLMGAAMLFAGFMTFATSFWRGNGATATQAASYISLLSVFGAFVSMSSGLIVEKFGAKALMALTTVGFIIGMVLVCLWPGDPTGWLAIISVLFVAFIKPISSMPSLVLPELFGKRDYTRLNSMSMAGYYAGTALASLLIGAIADATGSFVGAYICLAVIAAVSCALFLMALKLSPMKKLKQAAEK